MKSAKRQTRPAGSVPQQWPPEPRPGEDPFYILCPSPVADENNRVLKHGDTFSVLDVYGDIKPTGMCEEGLYHEGTRFLSSLLLWFGQERPLFLSSNIKRDNDFLGVDLTNPDVYSEDRLLLPRGTIHLFRSVFLWNGICYQRLRVRNFGLAPATFFLGLSFAADYADIFEVRGMQRKQRGRFLDDVREHDTLVMRYQGLDHVERRTRLEFSPAPLQVSARSVRYDFTLAPKEEAALLLTVACEVGAFRRPVPAYDVALADLSNAIQEAKPQLSAIATSNDQFNDWVARAAADLCMMTTQTEAGPYPYAGVPWFSTAFGRDGIITALQCLWLNPNMARGVLGFLAAHQATEVNPEQDAEPGKILHEMRRGEMAALGEIPFGTYYGSVDATPLFVMLAGAYFERTGDQRFIESIWPNLVRALEWIEHWGDLDGDGFIEYQRQTHKGLVQQGWKDSYDSVFHADGALAEGPVALCEVQGYAYAAQRLGAHLACTLGHRALGEKLAERAQRLREEFERAFWCEELSIYALALDGAKKPCKVRSSNAGQCLFTEIADPERARRTAQSLLGWEFFSGWGIRTIAASEVRYNPMSYHNGSVWPHDNALIALGMARYGLKEHLPKLLTGLFDASIFVDFHRLPELFCGFARRPGEGPTLYPVACAPQSWSAGALFMLLQACLGLSIDGPKRKIFFSYPMLPECLREVRIHNLRVRDAFVDLLFQRHARDVGINVLRKEGDVEISISM